MELIVQPDDGVAPLVEVVEKAQRSLDIVIFRFDLKPLEQAIEAAVGRGVAVRALIAHTNSGGERRLRQLELRMLDAGVSVSRTADDLVRYHGKMLLVDREELHVYGFNYTALDIKSRSFGLVVRDRRIVQEAARLFEADILRQPFTPTIEPLVVSPENARERFASFIGGAAQQLLIWDPKLTDPQMIRLLRQQVRSGVDVRILGKAAKRAGDLAVQKFPGRLHVRAMVRDGEAAFVGSQSLRALEIDGRRELGLITRDAKVVKQMVELFEKDWAKTDAGQQVTDEDAEALEEEFVAS